MKLRDAIASYFESGFREKYDIEDEDEEKQKKKKKKGKQVKAGSYFSGARKGYEKMLEEAGE
jgi:hypothetical protein